MNIELGRLKLVHATPSSFELSEFRLELVDAFHTESASVSGCASASLE
jgi:hypothetical protein